ncbi:MAG: GxxExxY protein [Candidatus Omnitrophica bacterium]|nr:GxxExxY protein [Candidatus Omnitrophota bacterium]
MDTDYKHSDITEKIIGAAYKIYNTLKFGFLEKVHENALALELRKTGLAVRQQEPIKVYYGGEIVGEYIGDIIVDGKVIVEVKAVKDLDDIHEVQLVNYLKATGIEVGLLINFGRQIEIKRKIFDR